MSSDFYISYNDQPINMSLCAFFSCNNDNNINIKNIYILSSWLCVPHHNPHDSETT